MYLLARSLCYLPGDNVPYFLLTALTVLVLVASLSISCVRFFFSKEQTSMIFTTLYGTLNLYIWVLTFSFAPLKEDDVISESYTEKDRADLRLLNADESNQPFLEQSRAPRRMKSTIDRYELPAVYCR